MAKQTTKEQKKEIILSLFNPTTVYNLKELEKLSSKLGIRSNLVKDLVTELTNDNLITSDKIGISTYYWRIPPNNSTEYKRLTSQLHVKELEKQRLTQQEQQLKAERCDASRADMIDEYAALSKIGDVPFCLEHYRSLCDGVDVMRDDVNRITEDVFVLRRFVCDTYGMLVGDFDRNFGVGDDFELLD
ncbi:Protein involved in meiotic recombination/predicted coiled-coil protein [Trachipleistophora hominis]|uniref:Protein involved in meiotic recombination/predicted coiled-coil protein n=1 Tax=Trachipleistophora hominis TaxID=72359 RepID=L7JYJ8_TRAHO|nr:Protein involved in meiotic recombination/predicted coiled-coil protein [Trachipleistophora hominis]